ncbi:MAG: lipid A deacylase LpxR family protein, partial [Phycisphaerales bacterium]|nr:lipid A deacylase LpxR family protein [Phycisphaerales bacterium]
MRHACVLFLMAAGGVACAQQFAPDASAFPRADAPSSRGVSLGMVGSMATSGVSFGSAFDQPDTDAPTSDDLLAPPSLHLTALTFYWENDGAYVKRFDSSDRHYTNGLRVEASLQPGLCPAFGEWLDSWLSIGATQRHAGGLALSQLMFTAEDISEPDLIESDRPYAGYLYTSLFHQRRTETVFDHVELQLGVVGEWSGAEGVQKAAHAAFPNEPRPQGWSNQLANELGVGGFYKRRWRS